MSNLDESRKLIEEMRAKRAALGDKTVTSRKLHYKRISRPKLARFVMFLYTFVSGMLFSAVLMGNTAAIAGFIIVAAMLVYSIWKE